MVQTETKVLIAQVPLSLAEKVDLMAERLDRSPIDMLRLRHTREDR
jgi:hypothetical protein